MKLNILICDPNAKNISLLQQVFEELFEVHASRDVAHAKTILGKHPINVLITELTFGGSLDGFHLLDHCLRRFPSTKIVVLSDEQSPRAIVSAMKRPLFEYLVKDGHEVKELTALLTTISQIETASSNKTESKYPTVSPAVLEMLEQAELILKRNSGGSILITGETGTGKELLANHLAHILKKRSVCTNMASIPFETAESILFGHVQGSFTGATRNKIGLIESANQGIFFLDEIGDCPLEIQSKLLRTLQENKVQPMGANEPRNINVQFIAATHQNLELLINQGQFREDLYHRLSSFTLHLPALRDRPEDILFYANLFLQKDNATTRPIKTYRLSEDATQLLYTYDWPGNIRQLEHVIMRCKVFTNSTYIDKHVVKKAILQGDSSAFHHSKRNQKQLTPAQILKALDDANWVKRKAATILGISEPTLFRKLRKWGVGKTNCV